MGYKAIETLHALKQGKPVPPYIDTGFVKCTPDMADRCGKN